MQAMKQHEGKGWREVVVRPCICTCVSSTSLWSEWMMRLRFLFGLWSIRRSLEFAAGAR